MTRIEPADFAEAMEALLQEYGEEVQEDVNQALKATAQEVTKQLKKAGDYGSVSKKPFRKRFKYEMVESRLETTAVIGNQKAGLTHLLEFGHARKNGGRNTEAFGFMAPINKQTEKIFMEKVGKML